MKRGREYSSRGLPTDAVRAGCGSVGRVIRQRTSCMTGTCHRGSQDPIEGLIAAMRTWKSLNPGAAHDLAAAFGRLSPRCPFLPVDLYPDTTSGGATGRNACRPHRYAHLPKQHNRDQARPGGPVG
jgi:hypothetical protein